jgi:hypothetical protein
LLVISNNSNPFGRNDPTVTVHKARPRRDQGATKARPRRDQGATKARPSRDYNTLRVSKVVEDEAGDHKRIPNLLGRCQMADGVGNWSAGGAVGQLCSLSLDEGDDLTIA